MNHAACDHPATKSARAKCRRQNQSNLVAAPITRLSTEDQNKIKTLEIRALDLIEEYGLTRQGWTFEWDRAARRLGCTKGWSRKISLSLPLARVNTVELMTSTIRHEIAHALVGVEHGHDEVWQAKARELGVPDSARCLTNVSVEPRYVAYCATCKKKYGVHRKTRNHDARACRNCCRQYAGGKFDERFRLVFKENDLI